MRFVVSIILLGTTALSEPVRPAFSHTFQQDVVAPSSNNLRGNNLEVVAEELFPTRNLAAKVSLEPVFSMYVPLPDDDLLKNIFQVLKNNAASPITDMISVAVPTAGTVVYYDHWEDGFDLGGAEVWGDGDPSNGCPPLPEYAFGCTAEEDKLKAGDVFILKNDVPCDARNPSQIRYDGGDLIKSTHPVVVTRAAYPAGPGSMMAGAVEVFDTTKWGTSFEAPVGKDLWHTTRAYEFTALAIMAGEDDTEITLNNSENSEATLKQGESITVEVDKSDTITSTKPVQVHLITGDVGDTYELRWYALAPTNQWSKTYYAPVGDTKGKVKVALYNPGPSRIRVKCTFKNGSTRNVNVNSKSVAYSKTIYDGEAAKFESSDIFFAFSSTDTSSGGQIYDWGYPLMTEEQLTPQVVVGLGFGCTDNDCDTSGERSIVWVTTVEDAEVWVDYNNDGKYDDHYSVRKLYGTTITDDSDEDMSGAVIWATEKGDTDGTGKGVNLAAAWGQKAALSRSGDSKALDLGTVVVPFEPTFTSCSIEILEDADGDGKISTGDLVEETIEVLNVGNFAVEDDTFAVKTGGGVVNLKPMETRGDTQIYKTQYRVPLGETVLGSCELVPYDPKEPVAPEPSPAPRSAAPVTTAPKTPSPSTAPKTSPPAPDAPTPADSKDEKAFSKGDPHFKTFGGELYDYHGECDLVLLHNPDFKGGLGMDIHIRTKIEDFWSSIESAAIKIGDDIMEIKADPEATEWLWFNGKAVTSTDGKWARNELGGNLVRYQDNGNGNIQANVYLTNGNKELLIFKTFKGFVRVDVDWRNSDKYDNSVGLLGSHAHGGKRLGRNGQFIEDVNAFGQEWQVIPEVDGSLFHSYEGAVVGKKCILPPEWHEGDDLTTAFKRRLGASEVDVAAAEAACNHLVDPDEIKACVFDVIATQDLSMASTW